MRRLHVRKLVNWLVGTCVMVMMLLVMLQYQDTAGFIDTQRHRDQRGFVQWKQDVQPRIAKQVLNNSLKHIEVKKVLDVFSAKVQNLSNNYGFNVVSRRKFLDEMKIDRAKLFPYPNETEDRVAHQMNLKVESQEEKVIVMWNGLSANKKGKQQFTYHDCPVTNCVLTADKKLAANADAILFMNSVPSPSAIKLPVNLKQVRILYMLESPYHSSALMGIGSFINWTATYRRDSVINTPYERFTFFPNITQLPSKPKKNYAEGKTKIAAWFVSNCNAPNKRNLYVDDLQKHVNVDIYGGCGKLKCPRKSNRCYDYLNKDYKFYLAFENSNCKDYITEKLYWNAFGNDIVPIVMGARPEDYKRTAPPHSYIHVDDFESPKHLADYLHKLDQNDDLYNEYFLWKGTGEFINTKFWCRLCSMVNIGTQFPMWYEDINKWWRGPEICVRPKEKPWATWRNSSHTVNDKFHQTVKYGYDREAVT